MVNLTAPLQPTELRREPVLE